MRKSGVEMPAAEQPHRHIGPAGADRFDQGADVVGRQVAEIGIQEQQDRRGGRARPGKHRRAFALILGEPQAAYAGIPGPGLLHLIHGVVCGSIVHDEDLAHGFHRAQHRQHLADVLALVAGRKDGRHGREAGHRLRG
jgi:hypothetical protein